MKELLRALRPVKKRIRRNRLLQGAAAGFAAGSFAALALLAAARFVPLEGKWLWAGAALAACVLLFAAGNAVRPVPAQEAAQAADACGLQERAVTALELAQLSLQGPAGELAKVQRQDACEHLRLLDIKAIRTQFPKRMLVSGCAALILCAGTMLLPGDGDRIAAERQALREKVAALSGQMDKAAGEDEERLGEKDKAELRKITEELKRDLDRSKDEADALVALDRAEKRMEQMRRKTAGETADQLADALRDAGLDRMAEALQSGDGAALQEALESADASALTKAAEGLSGEAADLARTLANGDLTAAELQAALEAMQGSGLQASQQALEAMKAALGMAGSQLKPGDQAGEGGTIGGASAGKNGAGGGAGKGSTNEDQGASASASSEGPVKGSEAPEYREGKYETIYDPEKAETLSRDVMTEQNRQGQDSVQIEAGPGRGRTDGDVPFGQVVGEYARTETRAAEQASLTREQKEWVDEYFRKLTDEE
ncbi:MAG: hypothetical protein IKQ45_01095 [Clostridia bacterium]|nr:hypothetical protein [Clostridia bacterium]